jgi:hypothetical protein
LEAVVAFEASPCLYGTLLACEANGLTVVLSWYAPRDAMALTRRAGVDPFAQHRVIRSMHWWQAGLSSGGNTAAWQ